MDILREMPRGQWWTLRNLFETNWPFGVEGYCLLDMLIKNPGLANSFNMMVYCPHGDISNGMIATSNVDPYHLFVSPVVVDNLPALEESLLNTGVIDWSKEIIMPSVTPEVMKLIDSVSVKLNIGIRRNGSVIKYLYSKHAPSFPIVEAPADTYLGPLRAEHLDLVNATWPYHNNTTKEYFRKLMVNNLMYVLYSNKDEPISWIGVDETGALCHLFSREACRRQGNGLFIIKAAMNDILSKDQNIMTYALVNNITPQKLFSKLGFQNLGLTSWLFLKKSGAQACGFCQVDDFCPQLKIQDSEEFEDRNVLN